MANRESIILNELFLPNSQDSEIWSPELRVVLDWGDIDHLYWWYLRTGGEAFPDRMGFMDFVSLSKVVEAVILYDQVVVFDESFPWETDMFRNLAEAGVVVGPEKTNSWVPAYTSLLTVAEKLYPTAFEEVASIQDSIYRSFVGNVRAVCFSQAIHAPLIPPILQEVDCVLIRRKLLASQIVSSLDMVYGDAMRRVYPAIRKICNAQGVRGVLVSPVIYSWLKCINERSINDWHGMLDVALELRARFARTRCYLRELSQTLCDPQGTFTSYRKATKHIDQLRKALSELANPTGERLFLFRLADYRTLVPSLSNLIKASNPLDLLRELGTKPIEWWCRRVRFRHVFHLFSVFDQFLNNREVAGEVSRFLKTEIYPSQIDWARKRDYELKNASQYRLLDDGERPHVGTIVTWRRL